jgi:hypothetical protein
MAKWPKSVPWHDGERKHWKFDNGYEISLVRFTGSYGWKKKLWELAIMYDGLFVDPPADNMENILDDYYKADEGIYGYLKDPDADRIVEMVKRL